MPAIAPVERPLFFAGAVVAEGVAAAAVVGVGVAYSEEDDVGEAEGEGVDEAEEPPSSGKFSPGLRL